jgi:hypothetical protein
MKLPKVKIILALALAAGGAFAQSNRSGNSAPAAEDYASFSRFITDRNIFDPNRVPHYSSSGRTTRTRTTRTRTSSGAPAITLVGTMSYEKGLFAFFSSNNEEYRTALPAGKKIADYTVAEITQGHVTLETADKKQKLALKVGDVLRQENGKWELSGYGETAAGDNSSSAGAPAAGGASSSGGESSPAAPPSATEANDVLKRLMQLREKESQ